MLLAIFSSALITYSMRFLPFVFMYLSPKLKAVFSNQKVIAPMGPCLIAAIAATSITPGFVEAAQTSVVAALVYLLGLFGAWLGFKLTKNAGLAVMIGMLSFALIHYLVQSFAY